jgi:hypothetical protein
VAGGPGGGKSIGPASTVSTNASDQRLEQGLSSGDNTITVPALAKKCVFTPPPTIIVVLKLKGSAGDVGTRISVNEFMVLSFDVGQTADFIINAASAITDLCTFDFV